MTAGSNLAPHIAYDDLREWLALAERLGEVKVVRGATWQEDIGLAAEAILRAENGPCVWRLRQSTVRGTRRFSPCFAGSLLQIISRHAPVPG